MTSIVIAGASLAGVRTAEGLRNKGFDGVITLVGDEADLPYDRPPLSKSALTKGESAETLAFHPESWYPDNGIDLRLGERALHLDPQRGLLRTTLSEIEFDDLVIATGARPRNPFPKAPTASSPCARSPTPTSCGSGCARAATWSSSVAGSSDSRSRHRRAHRVSTSRSSRSPRSPLPESRRLGRADSRRSCSGPRGPSHLRTIRGGPRRNRPDRTSRSRRRPGDRRRSRPGRCRRGAERRVAGRVRPGHLRGRRALRSDRARRPPGMGRRRRAACWADATASCTATNTGHPRRSRPGSWLTISSRTRSGLSIPSATCGRTSSGVESTSSATPQVTPPCGS
ncbi:FAD-dependent oxidoreductase, partial [Rhodococcus hoagii]|nr:FAD-dependent oxidoreductase [Prescottella equi]